MESARKALGPLKAGGRKIMGCFPLYPPLPLFHSMDFIPVVLWGLGGSPNGTPEADLHVQNYACSVARRLTQFVLADGKDLLDGFFFYNACDTLRNLPEILQAGLAGSGGAPLPMFRMHVPMTPASQADSSVYLRNEAQNLIANLETRFGKKFSEEKFRQSAGLYSGLRGLYLKFEDALSKGRTDFDGFCETMTRANFMAPEEQAELLESTISNLPSIPENKAFANRVFVSGILPPPPSVRRLIDEAGLLVIGNDIASLYRSYAVDPGNRKDAADYCVSLYRGHFPCSTLLLLSEKRMEAVVERALEKRAEGFIFVGEKFCEYEYFDIPDLERLLRDKGIATLFLEMSMDDDENAAALKTRIEAFAEVLSERAGTAGSVSREVGP